MLKHHHKIKSLFPKTQSNMIDLKHLRNHLEEAKINCKRRQSHADPEMLLKLDESVRQVKSHLDELRQQRNQLNVKMKAPLSKEEREPLIAKSKQMREQESDLESQYNQAIERTQSNLGDDAKLDTPTNS